MRFGETLKGERERRGIALDEISVATRVSLRNLRALEDERFQDLPGGVFNRGIVRSYARFCGMDEDRTVLAYTDAVRDHGLNPEMDSADWVAFAENVQKNRISLKPERRIRWAGVAAMCFGLLLLAIAVFALLAYRGVVPVPPRLQSLLQRSTRASRPQTAPKNTQALPDGTATPSDTP